MDIPQTIVDAGYAVAKEAALGHANQDGDEFGVIRHVTRLPSLGSVREHALGRMGSVRHVSTKAAGEDLPQFAPVVTVQETVVGIYREMDVARLCHPYQQRTVVI